MIIILRWHLNIDNISKSFLKEDNLSEQMNALY